MERVIPGGSATKPNGPNHSGPVTDQCLSHENLLAHSIDVELLNATLKGFSGPGLNAGDGDALGSVIMITGEVMEQVRHFVDSKFLEQESPSRTDALQILNRFV